MELKAAGVKHKDMLLHTTHSQPAKPVASGC